MEEYTVSGYNRRSETSYEFGPFNAVNLRFFLDKWDYDKWDEPFVRLLNRPDMYNTGKEAALG